MISNINQTTMRFLLICFAACAAFTLDCCTGYVVHRKEGWINSCSLAFQRRTVSTSKLRSSANELDVDGSVSSTGRATISNEEISSSSHQQPRGLYQPFATHAWHRLLQECGSHLDVLSLDSMGTRETPAPGVHGGTVRITIQAARGKESSLIQYARYALLETLSTDSDCDIQTSGIQVLNFVIFPTASSGLPVFGADFVALPGNKHLLLLDAQPMTDDPTVEQPADLFSFNQFWKEWYEKHSIATEFPWNSELPEQILPYVSKYALWTRLGAKGAKDLSESESPSATDAEPKDPIDQIRGPGMQAFMEHLDIYLELIQRQQGMDTSTGQPIPSRLVDYVTYRLENDPARPMLKRLYGEEWTEQVLHTVLFPLDELSI